MVRKDGTHKTELRERMRGGEGTVTIIHLAESGETPHCRLLAEIIIPPGAGIGEHAHNGETEYYVIKKGEGVVVDNGADVPVSKGDVVITGNGASHSIRNNGKDDLLMTAVIIQE